MNPRLTHLECSDCKKTYSPSSPQGLCHDCQRPLLARYNFSTLNTADITFRPEEMGMWSLADVLPVEKNHIVSLGEGATPLIPSRKLNHGETVWFKDEGQNPTGSFKDRGMSSAVSAAKSLGAQELFAPSAGNAGVSMAAYGARAGLPVSVAFPEGTPSAIIEKTKKFGATVDVVPGSIAEAGKFIRKRFEGKNATDLSTFREPYRLEGKKTLGYEIYFQLGKRLPDVLIYPAGGGTGLVGLYKAFSELKEIGFAIERLPRFYLVQAEGCCPLVKAFQAGDSQATPFFNPQTDAHGLRVPSTLADKMMLDIIRETEGGAIAVSEDQILMGCKNLARNQGLFVAPEAGATWAAYEKLREDRMIDSQQNTVLFLTANGSVYGEEKVVS